VTRRHDSADWVKNRDGLRFTAFGPEPVISRVEISYCSEPVTWSWPRRYAGTDSLAMGQRMHFRQWKRREGIALVCAGNGTAAFGTRERDCADNWVSR
jgi:hypothetical protein